MPKKKNGKKNNNKKKTDGIKPMPGEFVPKTINIGIDCRRALQHYYTVGGDSFPFGKFKAEIAVMGNKYLLKNLVVEFDDDGYYYCDTILDTEDHIWVYDDEILRKTGIKSGDVIEFTALAYAYHRSDGSEDYSLKCLQDIKKIDKNYLPTEQQMRESINKSRESYFEELVCETCLYESQCFRTVCIAPSGWREERIAEHKRLWEHYEATTT